MPPTIPYRTLGRTGERVSAIGLGGWHLGLERVDEQLSFRIIRTAIDRGVNFLDNCWDYNDGASETRMGKALRDGYRQKVFLMTKIDGRSYAEAMRQLDQSLERMQTDCIDFDEPPLVELACVLVKGTVNVRGLARPHPARGDRPRPISF